MKMMFQYLFGSEGRIDRAGGQTEGIFRTKILLQVGLA
jgi:hypothetical protein